ncbi:cation diffusion facilitator family transporter [Sporosalibacterium faouarense]|uniref:cation diffusion facilitator family transporter n=1 Tax=Sporosalibacterium faouarense TaxID=516123 RepID=UPI001FB01E7E|nr:cation diffusion facilitator family transporter [Sporosalibacterium faouarense]
MKSLTEKERYRIGNKITWITIIINVILAIVKVGVGIIANSTAILADGMHTISDVGSSIGIIIGLFISQKPEDEEHQYGHEKAESIAGFILAILLVAVGLKIGYSTIEMMVSGDMKVPGLIAAWVATGSIIVKEFQYRVAMYGGKKINSSALIADAWHHRSDALSSIAALIGIIGSRLGYTFLDPVAGFVVSIIVLKVGVELFIKGYNELMDSSIEKTKLQQIILEIKSHEGIINIGQIKTRKHGSKVFFDIKICVKSNITVVEGHEIAEEVEDIVYKNIGGVKDVLVHVNPCEDKKRYSCEICKK